MYNHKKTNAGSDRNCTSQSRVRGSAVKHFQIQNSRDQKTIYEDRFRNFKSCVEQAVRENVRLAGADLSKRNLSNAMLDCGQMIHVDFSNSNLTGANLSEAQLAGAAFINADLYNTCFAWSD